MKMNKEQITTDDWLERVLRADARDHAATYLADDGFTARVVGQLPRPAALPAWRRTFVVVLWAIVAVAVLAALPFWFDDVFSGTAALFIEQKIRLADLALLLTLLGGVTWSALFFAARAE